MPDHYAEVYQSHADRYEQLVSREDYEGNIVAALRRITPLEGRDIIDSGAGTGRLACLVAPFARSLRVYDSSAHMLDFAAARLRASGLTHWHTAVADHRQLPAENQSADIVLAGWSVVYTVVWEEDWRAELGRALTELTRVLRLGGKLIILETLGTGFVKPHPPEGMLPYFAYLENEAGFTRSCIRTDYRFASVEEARELTSFFFEDDMTDRLINLDPPILPECTGIWERSV
ncbi:MAG: class I SAM-dependent methyltransferase [Anaerolineae bacterium]|nr:class I SAM-dependent methyltransferase [Anaerolineae bacterium]